MAFFGIEERHFPSLTSIWSAVGRSGDAATQLRFRGSLWAAFGRGDPTINRQVRQLSRLVAATGLFWAAMTRSSIFDRVSESFLAFDPHLMQHSCQQSHQLVRPLA
jgi:hypothetical protein